MTKQTLLRGFLVFSCLSACWSLKECIDPLRASKNDELTCSSEFSLVPQKICHYNDPTCPNSEGSDVCAFVIESIFADWKMLDAAFYTSGSCQEGIEEGRFTAQDALKSLPNNYEMVGIRVLGKDLRQALENQLVDYYVHGNKAAYPHTAGLKFNLELLKPAGERIENLKVLSNTCNWRVLSENESYMILTNIAIAETIFGGKTLETSHTKRGETEMFWSHTSSVCFLKDNWHQMRLKHEPQTIPLSPSIESAAATQRTVVSSE